MNTLGQMDVVAQITRELASALPDGMIQTFQLDAVIAVSNRIIALFNGEGDPFSANEQTIVNIKAQALDKKPYEQAIVTALGKLGVETVPTQLNRALPNLATHLGYGITRTKVMTTPGMTLEAWLHSDDTGLSSLFIASVLAPAEVNIPDRGRYLREANTPKDADDFGRCYRLLSIMPEWRARLGEVAQAGEARRLERAPERAAEDLPGSDPECGGWPALVNVWQELTTSFEAGDMRVVSDRIAQLIR